MTQVGLKTLLEDYIVFYIAKAEGKPRCGLYKLDIFLICFPGSTPPRGSCTPPSSAGIAPWRWRGWPGAGGVELPGEVVSFKGSRLGDVWGHACISYEALN